MGCSAVAHERANRFRIVVAVVVVVVDAEVVVAFVVARSGKSRRIQRDRAAAVVHCCSEARQTVAVHFAPARSRMQPNRHRPVAVEAAHVAVEPVKAQSTGTDPNCWRQQEQLDWLMVQDRIQIRRGLAAVAVWLRQCAVR